MQSKSTVLLTEREVAERLRLGANTLAKWRLRGEGPRYVKIGSRIRYDETALVDWIASRTRASTSQTAAA